MNTSKTVQMNALKRSIKTTITLIDYDLNSNDFDLLEMANKRLNEKMSILIALKNDLELNYTQQIIIDAIVEAHNEIDEEEAQKNV